LCPAPTRGLVVTTVVALLGLLLTGCAGSGSGESAPAPDPGRVGEVTATDLAASFPASDVLRRWDRARGRAFADGDPAALSKLYVDGSAAGTADLRLLRAYLRRGLRVEGMRMQLLRVEVLHDDPARLRLRVTDRLTGAVAVGRGTRLELPRDAASTRVVELRRPAAGAQWRVAEVRESVRRPTAR
jgi:hypothetical protein